jgi:hypothetical protein
VVIHLAPGEMTFTTPAWPAWALLQDRFSRTILATSRQSAPSSSGIEQSQIGDEVQLIVSPENGLGRDRIGDGRLKWRLGHVDSSLQGDRGSMATILTANGPPLEPVARPVGLGRLAQGGGDFGRRLAGVYLALRDIRRDGVWSRPNSRT